MKDWILYSRTTVLVTSLALFQLGVGAQSAGVVDAGQAVLDPKAIAEGLFPEDECEQLKAAGFKCMGFKPSMRYSLPATSFKVGSAELPDLLKKQLEVFADVLKTRRGSGKVVRIVGHADASGAASANLALSQKRAEAVREFLVQNGADPAMLLPVGMGASAPKNASDPFSAENRRVEIGRADAPR
jgi:outer membrane protein OmpA-like peptidoglycan-associated protein